MNRYSSKEHRETARRKGPPLLMRKEMQMEQEVIIHTCETAIIKTIQPGSTGRGVKRHGEEVQTGRGTVANPDLQPLPGTHPTGSQSAHQQASALSHNSQKQSEASCHRESITPPPERHESHHRGTTDQARAMCQVK